MVRVCKKWFPNEKHPEKSGFYMDDRLKLQIDVLLKNIIHDWDFTIIITGSGEVRVGKSVLAMQIACYWAYEIWRRYKKNLPWSVKDNFCFEGDKLIKQGNYLGQRHPYSPLIFDEAGADLEGRKTMQATTQAVLDYFRECGQYNMLNVLVLPEFFDLPKGIALSRSIFLLDVTYTADDEGIFKRGYFDFYSRRSKKWLYIKGKKILDYKCVKSDFGRNKGRFYKFYPVDEGEYRKAKQEALSRREIRKRSRFQVQRDALIYLMCGEKQEKGIKIGDKIMTQQQLSQRLEQLTGISIARNTLSDALRRMKIEMGDNDDE